MSRKSVKEKIGIFFITLGILGGLYGLFLALNHRAVAATEERSSQSILPQQTIDQIEFEKEELQDEVQAYRSVTDYLRNQLRKNDEELNLINQIVGWVEGETGVDGIDAFLAFVQSRLRQEGRFMVPGAILFTDGPLTLGDLLKASHRPRERLHSV